MCKISITLTTEQLSQNIPADIIKKHFDGSKEIRAYKGAGCKVCHGTGYSGRIGVFEVLEMTAPIKKLITEKSESDIIARKAIEEGMATMLDDGLDKVLKGLTTVEEVLRVTKVESV
jgi:type II secretory ATPase GspE/PulE/Tfp pilus assembly ATPase PilB-like protein